MKLQFSPVLILLLTACATQKQAIESTQPTHETPKEIPSSEGLASIRGIDIPEKLTEMGFTQYHLIGYRKEANTEYFTFSDWRTEIKGDMVTFRVQGAEVKEWFEEEIRDKDDVGI
ncbi:MAG: hypothetical protein ABH872_01300 [Candidatus Omnitrophota bacterium]